MTTWSWDQKAKGNLHWDEFVQFMVVWLTSKTVLCRSNLAEKCEENYYIVKFRFQSGLVGKTTLESLDRSSYTLQKFGMCGEIYCLEKRFKICHILYIVSFFVFHFVLLYFFSLINLITHTEFLRSDIERIHKNAW